MTEIFNKYKQIIIGGAVVVLIVMVLVFLRGNGNYDSTTLVPVSDNVTSVVDQNGIGQKIIVALGNLRRLSVDVTIFQDPVFLSLIDHRQSTTSESIGRPDPFLQLPIKSSTITVTGAGGR